MNISAGAYKTMQQGAQFLLALVIVAIVALSVVGKSIPPEIGFISAAIVGYLFGNKAAETQNITVKEKRNDDG